MSIAKSLKRLEQERDDALTQVEVLNGTIEELNATVEQANEAKAELDATVASLNERVEAADAKAQEQAEMLENLEQQIASLTAEKEELAKSVAANPAFAQAAAGGDDASTVVDDAVDAPAKSVWAEYNAITDHKARSKFWREHAEELQSEYQASVRKEE